MLASTSESEYDAAQAALFYDRVHLAYMQSVYDEAHHILEKLEYAPHADTERARLLVAQIDAWTRGYVE